MITVLFAQIDLSCIKIRFIIIIIYYYRKNVCKNVAALSCCSEVCSNNRLFKYLITFRVTIFN